MTLLPDVARILGAGDWFDPDAELLLGSACGTCGRRSFPPRMFCWWCRGPMSRVALPPAGVMVARSTVRVSPPGYPDDYDVGVVALGPDLHVLARFEGPAPAHGDAVSVRAGLIRQDDDQPVWGPVFVSRERGPVEAWRLMDTPPAGRKQPPRRVGEAWIVGVATTRFGRPDQPAEELAAAAALAAVEDAGLHHRDVDALVVGSAFSTAALGQRMLRFVPWGGCPVVNVENACASGSTALAQAVDLVRAGGADVVLAIGADVPVRSGGGLIPLDRSDPVAGIGVTLPSLYALVADRYRARYGAGVEAFAEVVVRSRRNAALNADAFQRTPVTAEDVLASRAIADPLTLWQCSPNADGAAAAVVVSERVLARTAHVPVEVAGLSLQSGMTKDRFTGESVVARVSADAYAEAGVRPADIGVVELHDAFAPAALTNLEALGLAEPGLAASRLMAGDFAGHGDGPALNPSGGLLSRGHPPGATGLAQVAEVVRQLRGEAGDRQLSNPGVGMFLTMGGTVLELETNACAVGILRREGAR